MGNLKGDNMGAGPKWTEQEKANLIKYSRKGWRIAEIAKKLGRPQDATRQMRFLLTRKMKPIAEPWYEGAKFGFFDIETAGGFKGNAGFMLSWALCLDDGTVLSDCVTPKEIYDLKFDKRIVESFVEAASKHCDILVGYYNVEFDTKYLRTRATMNKVPFWPYGGMMQLDPYYAVKSHYALTRNSMETACKVILGKSEKTHFDAMTWIRAQAGDKKALAMVLDHNKRDVRDTRRLWHAIKGLQKWQPKSV
jgi:uncharacterized protein YprB with RNaseH-like and TPR domain